MKPNILISCDFDGTITRNDTLVEILDQYGSPRWREVQAKVVSGEMTIREGLQREMGSIQADMEQIKQLLKTRVELDPGFPAFFQEMRTLGVPVIILSGGFDLCVETVMGRHGLWPVPYLANRLHQINGSWEVEYPYPSAACSACGHCKGDPIREWNRQGYTTVFIGNGVTDRCAALEASVTFAKDELGSWCRTQKIAAVAFKSFTEIREELAHRGWL